MFFTDTHSSFYTDAMHSGVGIKRFKSNKLQFPTMLYISFNVLRNTWVEINVINMMFVK